VGWIQHGSDRWYAFAAAVANTILVAGLARFIGGAPVGERRVLLGAVAIRPPVCGTRSVVGVVLGGAVRAA
jgi:hypothetical protein